MCSLLNGRGRACGSRSGLTHPVFLIALSVLVVNDHLLKGAGVLPGWCTGKLSDFAGLIVLPVLVSQVPALHAKRGRAMVCACVGIVFAAINLWPAASATFEMAAAGVGMHWRLWPDPSDLVALPVLAAAFHIAQSTTRFRVAAPWPRVVAVVASVACLATGETEGGLVHDDSYVPPGTGGMGHVGPSTSSQRAWAPCEPFSVQVKLGDDAGEVDDDAGAMDPGSMSCGDFTALAVGPLHVCGLHGAGTITCWGGGGHGPSSGPTDEIAMDFVQVVVGHYHACGLRTDGSLTCWGGEIAGEVSGPNDSGAADFVALTAGDFHTCGLRTGGSIRCWGLDDYGQVSGPSGVSTARWTDVTAGAFHTCALGSDGAAACWGKDDYRQSSGSDAAHSTPYTALTAGDKHTCALRADGYVRCWGDTGAGKTSAPGGVKFTQIAAGDSHTCGLAEDSSLSCWGDDTYLQGSLPAAAGDGFTQIGAGGARTCALRQDGELICWGDRKE